MPVITIFGGGNIKSGSVEYKNAERLGSELAKRGFDIATGAYGGVMEAVLKGASKYDTRKIGISTEFYSNININKYVTEEIKTNDYFERLIKLIEIGDMFIALPGGSGTLLEIAAVWALKNKLVLKDKMIITVGDIWSDVIQTMAFYEEKVVGRLDVINVVDNIKKALNLIDKDFNINNILR